MSNFERSREIANPCTYDWDLLVTNFNRRVSELPIAYRLLPCHVLKKVDTFCVCLLDLRVVSR